MTIKEIAIFENVLSQHEDSNSVVEGKDDGTEANDDELDGGIGDMDERTDVFEDDRDFGE